MSDVWEWIFVIALLVFNLGGAIWLGIVLDHFILVPLGWIIISAIVTVINETAGIVLVFIAAGVTLIAIIVIVVRAIMDASHNKKIQKEQKQKNSALLDAVIRGDKQTVKELIEAGASNHTLLDIAVNNHDKEMVSLLIEKGTSSVKENESLLKNAAENLDKEIVSLLLENGANVNYVYDGKTLLDFVKDNEIIDILKKYGAKTKSELDEAARRAAAEVAERNKKQQELNKSLAYAVLKHDVSLASNLISEGADVNYATEEPTSLTWSGFPLIFFAMQDGDSEMISLLLKNGADVRKEVRVITGGYINAITFARYQLQNERLASFLEHY